MWSLKIRLLGAPSIETHDGKQPIRRRKSLALLAYLAVSGLAQQRDAMATMLWPENDQKRARANLRSDLSRLKRAIGKQAMQIEGDRVGLQAKHPIWLDTKEFESLIKKARRHPHGDPVPVDRYQCPDCAADLTKAVSLYGDDFMAGFSLPDCPAFDEWQFFQSESLRQMLAEALQQMIRWHAFQGEYEVAIGYSRRWLGLDPLHEPAQRQLMQIYAENGQQAAAIRQYKECKRLMKEELGIEPEIETTRLYEAIRTRKLISAERDEEVVQIPAAASVPAAPEAKTYRAIPNNLPQQTTPFIGREEELRTIQRLLLDEPACRLLSLLGPGGSGKTRLALEAAATVMDGFPQGVFFISMAAVTHPDFIFSAMAEALRIKLSASTPPKAQLLETLQNRKLLLLVDNFEHLLEVAGLLGEISSQAGQVKILVTTRERLNLHAEWALEIEGLPFPKTPTYPSNGQIQDEKPSQVKGALQAYPAVQLFLASIQRTKVGLRVKDCEYPVVARITQLAEGMPLALELAASWASVLRLEDIADEMARSLDILETDMQDVSPRQRSMRATFDHSWELLSSREKQIFARLSVFRGGFTLQAGQEIADVSQKDLMWRVNKSLLKREVAGRLGIHELLRQYASEKLAENPALVEEAHKRHCCYYCKQLKEWGKQLEGAAQRQALKEMEADLGNIQFAWKWATEQSKPEWLDLAVDGLGQFYVRRGLYREGLEASRSAVAALVGYASGDQRRVLAHLLGWQGRFSSLLGAYDAARQVLRESTEILEDPGIDPLQARKLKAMILYWAGDRTYMTGRSDEARELLEQSLSMAEEIEDHYLVSEILWSLQLTAIYMQSQFDQAEEFSAGSLAAKRALGDRFGLASELLEIGSMLAYDLGKVEEAQRSFQESQEILRESDDPLSQALRLRCKHYIAKISGRFAEALEYLQKEGPIYEEMGDRHSAGLVYIFMSEVYLGLGEYGPAERRARQALMIWKNFMDLNPFRLLALWPLADALLAQGKVSEAKMVCEEAVVFFQHDFGKQGLGLALTKLGRTEYAEGHLARAWERTLEALDIFTRARHYYFCSAGLAMLALLLAEQGEAERAVEVYALATRHPTMASSIWYAELYGKYIDEAAKDLPLEVSEAAKARGREQDFWQTVARLAASIPNYAPRYWVKAKPVMN